MQAGRVYPEAGVKSSSHTVLLSPTLRRLLVELQTWCTADCCKDGAFAISAAAICRWLDGERIDRTQQLLDEVAGVQSSLQAAGERITLDARGLESDWRGDVFREFWDRFAVALASAIADRNVAEAEPGAAADGEPR